VTLGLPPVGFGFFFVELVLVAMYCITGAVVWLQAPQFRRSGVVEPLLTMAIPVVWFLCADGSWLTEFGGLSSLRSPALRAPVMHFSPADFLPTPTSAYIEYPVPPRGVGASLAEVPADFFFGNIPSGHTFCLKFSSPPKAALVLSFLRQDVPPPGRHCGASTP